MTKNYFRIAWRNFIRNRAFLTANTYGLALGRVGLLIMLWERSADSFQADGKQLLQVYERRYYNQ